MSIKQFPRRDEEIVYTAWSNSWPHAAVMCMRGLSLS